MLGFEVMTFVYEAPTHGARARRLPLGTGPQEQDLARPVAVELQLEVPNIEQHSDPESMQIALQIFRSSDSNSLLEKSTQTISTRPCTSPQV